MADIIDFYSGTRHPMVVTFGLGRHILEGTVFAGLLREALEEFLLTRLRGEIHGVLALGEQHHRVDQNRILRVAIWSNSVDAVSAIGVAPWEVLDFSEFTRWYPNEDPSPLYARAVSTSGRSDST